MDIRNLRVLEVGSDLAVVFCGLQFARWGADVRVAADHVGDLPRQAPLEHGISIPWTFQSAGKSLVQGDVGELAREADVLLTSLDRDVLAAVGIIPGADTITHYITPYASGGEFAGEAGLDLMLEASAGYLNINGTSDREPARAPGNMVSYIGGVGAFAATLAALHKRLATGETETIETSKLDVLTTITPFVRSQYTQHPDTRMRGGPGTGVRLWPVGDGHLSANLYGKNTFAMALEHMGISEDEVPDHLDTPEKRYDTEAMNAFLTEKTVGISAEKVFNDMLTEGAAGLGLLQTPKQVLANEHLRAIGYFQTLDHPELGTLQYPGNPARFRKIDAAPVLAAIPARTKGWARRRLPSMEVVATGGRPLDGIRIIDFTQAWIGPFATMMLADLGAEVIKIESHKRVDVWRNWAGNIPPSNVANDRAHPCNTSANFNSANRNKREIAIDLNRPEGVEIARQLIRGADLVMNNYTPRVMKKFGLDHESIRDINPTIISVAWAGYGNEGPYANYKANGTTTEAIAGWDSLFGYRDDDPMVMGFYQADAITGLQMAACALLALVHRDLTGEGQSVNGSMIKSAVPYIGEEMLKASLDMDHQRLGNRHPDMAPHGVFPCAGDNQYVAIACRDDDEWQRLCDIVGIDARKFPRLGDRRRHEDQLEGMIAAWTRSETRDAAEATLRRAGIPASAVLNALEILRHPEFTKRDWFQPQVHPDMGEKLHGGFPWRFEHATLRGDYPPPRLGEHSEEILSEVLGYEPSRIASLFDADVIGHVFENEIFEKTMVEKEAVEKEAVEKTAKESLAKATT